MDILLHGVNIYKKQQYNLASSSEQVCSPEQLCMFDSENQACFCEQKCSCDNKCSCDQYDSSLNCHSYIDD